MGKGVTKKWLYFFPPPPRWQKTTKQNAQHTQRRGGGEAPGFFVFFLRSFPQLLPPGRHMLGEPSTKPYLSHGRWKGKTRQGGGKTKRKSKRKASMAKKIHGYSTYKEDGGGKAPEKRKSGAFLALHPFCMFRTKYYGVVRSTYLYCGKPQRSIICIPVVLHSKV